MELDRDARQLCHGISFSEHEPAPTLRLRLGERWINEALPLSRNVTLTVGAQKYCLGYLTMNTDGSRQLHACPKLKAVSTGTQCDFCRRRDQSRYMHQFHRTGEAPAGMRKYLEQPHFLYVASFAHGASKVGTTSTQSRWSRLAQQGVVSARYIARAGDGAAIRVLEDLVTEHAGLGQQVRQKSKIKGLTAWELDLERLDLLNAEAAEHARSFLAGQRGLEGYGIELLDEPWVQPGFARPVIDAWNTRSIHPWGEPLPGTRVQIRVRGVLGQSILADSGEDTTLRLIDAAELKTRDVSVRQAPEEFREQQSALF